MTEPTKDTGVAISHFRVAVVMIFVLLNLAVLVLRVISVWHYGELAPFGSPQALFGVWRGIHHVPVYSWPLKYPYTLALYNYLFYFSYAFLLRLLGATGAGITLWGCAITPVFAIIGALAQWKLVQSYLNLRGARSLLSLLFAVGLWFCASIVRYWALSIRPDMAAIAFVMVALWICVRRPRFGFAYAGVLFYLAWSFKQSVILALAGVCLFLLFQKRWRDLTLLAAVFAALIAATLLLGTPEYRYNILIAPRVIKGFSWMWAMQIAPKSLLANAYWILAPLALWLASGARRLDDTVRLLSTAFAVALAGGVLAMTKVGGWDNYLFEAFVCGSTLLQIAVFAAPVRLVDALLLFGCIQPALQVVTKPSGTHVHTFGTVGISTPAEYADAVAMRNRLASMKKPLFTPDPIFSLPWFSNDNRPPVLMIDIIFHDATRASCEDGCVEGMLKRGEIPTVLLPVTSRPDPSGIRSDAIYRDSLNPRYKKVGEYRYDSQMWSLYSLTGETPDAQSTDGQSLPNAH